MCNLRGPTFAAPSNSSGAVIVSNVSKIVAPLPQVGSISISPGTSAGSMCHLASVVRRYINPHRQLIGRCSVPVRSGGKEMSTLRVALVQLYGRPSKKECIANALEQIRLAKDRGARLIILPECFNSPYSTAEFGRHAEEIPRGETSQALAKVAAELGVYLVGGTYPEREGTKLYNTCPVFGPKGELLCKYRKLHLFDMDIPGRCSFKESSALAPGDRLATFTIGSLRIGLGICWDKRFPELSSCYRQLGCDMLIFPSAFDPYTGPLHWELLGRARALDNQMFVALVSPARDPTTEYVAYGYSLMCDPWGRVLCRAKEDQELLITDIDLKLCAEIKQQIPILRQKRSDIYELRALQ